MISIDNKNLRDYVMFKLDKIDNDFTLEELNKITEVVINFNEEENDDVVRELSKLTNLKQITFRNGLIKNSYYEILLNLKDLNDVTFESCDFEHIDLIASLNLKSLSLINIDIDNLIFINNFNLEELTLINTNINVRIINKQENLKYLQISSSNVTLNEEINLPHLEELYIDNTNVNNFEFINNIKNIKRISIDESQFNNNKELFINLIKKDILVYNENMVMFEENE